MSRPITKIIKPGCVAQNNFYQFDCMNPIMPKGCLKYYACSVQFACPENLVQMRTSWSPAGDSSITYSATCPICDKNQEFYNAKKIQLDQLKYKQKIGETYILNGQHTVDDLHDIKFTCTYCQAIFETREDAVEIETSSHRGESYTLYSTKCPCCEKKTEFSV